jgi:hypothetical protein
MAITANKTSKATRISINIKLGLQINNSGLCALLGRLCLLKIYGRSQPKPARTCSIGEGFEIFFSEIGRKSQTLAKNGSTIDYAIK